ncbi:unnamed protein product [Rotaria sp. Silwood2]|nr:unnamed protein product [Rotaria sp. Silwood2]
MNASLGKAGACIEEAEFRYDFLHHHQNSYDYQVAVYFEDATAVIQKITYNAVTNTFTEFSIPLKYGIPIFHHYQTDSFDQLKYWFENTDKSNYLNVHVVQPLIVSNPYSSPFLLAAYGIRLNNLNHHDFIIHMLNEWYDKNRCSMNISNEKLIENEDFQVFISFNGLSEEACISCSCGIKVQLSQVRENFSMSNYYKHLKSKRCMMIKKKKITTCNINDDSNTIDDQELVDIDESVNMSMIDHTQSSISKKILSKKRRIKQ